MMRDLIANGPNFDEFKSGGLYEKHELATQNLGTIPESKRLPVEGPSARVLLLARTPAEKKNE
jgi:hypothetical protein